MEIPNNFDAMDSSLKLATETLLLSKSEDLSQPVLDEIVDICLQASHSLAIRLSSGIATAKIPPLAEHVNWAKSNLTDDEFAVWIKNVLPRLESYY